MKFEYEDQFDETEGLESIFASEHDELLSRHADAVTECMCGNPAMQCVAEDILDAVEDLIDTSRAMVSVSRSMYLAGQLVDEGCLDRLDVANEFNASCEYLLDLVTNLDDSSRYLIEIVRDLTGTGGPNG
jgi:hypothetical protein